jgi:hypothetical protein
MGELPLLCFKILSSPLHISPKTLDMDLELQLLQQNQSL